ncbi:signal transduction histidine kinase/ActR/RegA family two-component response regulator [Sphingomonas vulcanisoli]|uniref:histidine kinase n=1 Tax=Sphingomonas vulcanisoli TaxID=1658060 RepID=A0ABX0TVE6_9SPHN|nr:ATP-binding protein [Sphingomonas vulcanisoli]NIJ09504.1 signal transduction histidine kinase/ActR/RegA family two-component response regulator [Sphingomonas vulcanisoli]
MGDEGVNPQGGVTLGYRLLAAVFGVITAVLLAVLIILVQQSNHERDLALAQKQHSFDVMMLTSELDGALARSEAALSRFITDGDAKGNGAQYLDQWRRAGRDLDTLADLTADNPVQFARVGALQRLYLTREQELGKSATLANYKRGWAALSLFSRAGRSQTLPQIAKLIHMIQDTERSLLDERSAAAAARVHRSNLLAWWLSAVGASFALAMIATGWAAMIAWGQERRARDDADVEILRTQALENAVAARTQELSEANRMLTEEAATRAEAEAKLRQIQKMEAVGQLTGGIAHDFNNMLAVVLGGLELARNRVTEQAAEANRHIENAMEGANRAAALTRRLLSFARTEPLLPSAVDPDALIRGMNDLIDRTIGERIAVKIVGGPDIWPVWIDPYQLENAILNLCVNARDAMAGAGVMTMKAVNRTIRTGEINLLPAGDYVEIAVEDDGAGMSPEVLERVFEPFFTTKPVGEGTGLGLSQIFGFARQSHGDVIIRSTLGVGTIVSLFLPRHRGEATALPAPDPTPLPAPKAAASALTILLVEDDVRVRAASADALGELGYHPLPCASAEEAIALLDTRSDIGLLMTDVVMPGMTGPELVAAIRPRLPELPVLFVTGYVGEAGEAEMFEGHEVLRKPYTLARLASAVTAAMARVEAVRDQKQEAA